jgi:hypothetical protein
MTESFFAFSDPPRSSRRPGRQGGASWPFSGPVGQVPPDQLRVSDAERSEVLDLLCRHCAEGRLEQAELEERSAQVSAAKTRRELAAVLVDLPPLGTSTPQRSADTSALEPSPIRRHGFLRLLAACLAVWVLAGWVFGMLHVAAHFLVPWPLGVLALVLFVRSRRRRRWADRL